MRRISTSGMTKGRSRMANRERMLSSRRVIKNRSNIRSRRPCYGENKYE